MSYRSGVIAGVIGTAVVAGAGGGLNKHAMSHSFLAQAANKKSMQLDLSMAKGQEIFRRLAADSDVRSALGDQSTAAHRRRQAVGHIERPS